MVAIQTFAFETISLTIATVHFKVEGNGNCMFATIKKSLQVRHSGPGRSRDKGRELPYYQNRYFKGRWSTRWLKTVRR